MIFNTVSGGAPLNFNVLAYETEEKLKADSQMENTIGVVTATDISSWVFSPEEPAEPSEGMVWFFNGTNSSVEFDALKNKNAIQLYPVSAQQYVSGAWVNVVAMSYRDGAWVNLWNGELYTPGNEFKMITGGWIAEPKGRLASAAGTAMPTLNKDDNGMAMQCTAGGVVRTANKVDLTRFSRLCFTGDLRTSGSRDDWMRLCIWSEMGTYWNDNIVAQRTSSNTEYGTQYIEIESLEGKYYIGFGIYASGCLMENLKLE